MNNRITLINLMPLVNPTSVYKFKAVMYTKIYSMHLDMKALHTRHKQLRFKINVMNNVT